MAADLKPFQNSLVRVLDTDGNFYGMGFVYEPRVVITCAHVVAEALDGDATSPEKPKGQVRVDRPFHKGTSAAAEVVRNGWHPKRPSGQVSNTELADLAVLALDQPLCDPAEPKAKISSAETLGGVQFLGYGGIEGWEQDPVPVEGQVKELRGDGRYKLKTDEGDYRVEHGCSGSPAVDRDTGWVIGLLVQSELRPDARVGFLISAAHLREALCQARPDLPAAESRTSALMGFRHHITSPSRLPASELANALKRLIDHYTDLPNEPVPFVGRDEELEELDGWVAGSGSNVMLVSSPAGRGKSALLLHWLARTNRSSVDTTLLYAPISIRFGTNDEERGLRLLYNVLRGLFKDLTFDAETKADIEDYRERIHQGWTYIANRPEQRYVLVMDGLDEAMGAWVLNGVLPYETPPNLKLILAARHEPGLEDGASWLDKLGLSPYSTKPDRTELGLLPKDAVGEVVAHLGHPLDDRVESTAILDRLYALTDHGDPLLISLWVKQLWEARDRAEAMTAQTLESYQPGFTGFYDVWRKEQSSLWKAQALEVDANDLDRLLEVLAVAEGSLYLRDLLKIQALLKERDVQSLPVVWDYEKARKVLGTTSRLIIGDGERDPYTFVHPRIADYFNERADGEHLIPRQQIERAFCAWGREVVTRLNKATLSPRKCPEYLLHHYAVHVDNADFDLENALTEHLLPLMDGGWHRAWVEYEGAYSGFLTDIDRVHLALRTYNEQLYQKGRAGELWLGEELGCLLIHSSIWSLNANLPPELIIMLVKGNIWTPERAARVAVELPEAESRVSALVNIAHQIGNSKQKEDFLQQALIEARGIEAEWVRARALVAVAEQLGGKSELLAEALVAARGVSSEFYRTKALVAVVAQLGGESELLAEALVATRGFTDEGSRTSVLVAAAEKLDGESRSQVLAEALVATRGVVGEWSRARALVAVVEQLGGESELLAEALVAVRGFTDEGYRARALVAVAEQLDGESRSQVLAEALVAARGVADERYRAGALVAAAEQLDGERRSQVLAAALVAARGIADEEFRVAALVAVAKQLDGESRSQVLAEALAAVRSIAADEGSRAKALVAVVEQLGGESELLAEALCPSGNRAWNEPAHAL